MIGKAGISLTAELQDLKKMPVTRGRLAVIAAGSTLALLAAAGCSSGGSTAALARASTAPPASMASHTYASKYFRPPLTVTVDASLKSPPVTDFTTFLTWDAVGSSDNKVRFLVPTNVYRPGSFVSQAAPKDYLRWLQGLTRHGVKLSNVVKITVDGHPATLMTATTTAAHSQEFFAGTLGCPDPADDQIESCYGIPQVYLARLAVIPVGKTTLLAWARTSKAHPDEAFFAMFERMLNSVRFR
jgi:hypothetical protein